ncbi:NifU family protein [Flexivirga sp. ID2601S]|uniref:NifU family protein n=1 Tax=Flexivirga aerilata TaxID=1656889 RepID=A0A849AJU5_9MICO|nr:NifU family protein [Flexivirga aerilata]NNG41104.1 NifU family protein [Flexivirga aerilata]
MVALHPEPVAADPRSVRWVTGADVTPFVGPVQHAAEPLEALLQDGTVESLRCESDAVVVRLADGLDWRTAGASVRSSLREALADPQHWQADSPAQWGDDARLEAAAREVIDGPAGDYVRSHGGRVWLVSARDGLVEVGFAGTCSHCPAAGFTLQHRIAAAIRDRHPGDVEVVAAEAEAPRRQRWLTLGRR